MSEDTNVKRQIRPWQGIIVLLLAAACIFVISPLIGAKIGFYGSLVGELLLLLLAVLSVILFRGSLREVFPIHKPKAAVMFGTILLWVGTFLLVMVITLIISALFPEEMLGTSFGLAAEFTSVPFVISFFIISITPAVCEEAVFRGVFLNSLKPLKNKWAAIIISGLIFGAFHGSIWRFFPTALLGMMLAYLMTETGNIVYSAFFHAVNNALPIIILYALKDIYAAIGTGFPGGTQIESISLLGLGLYMMLGALAPFCIYVGNFLIHSVKPGYRETLFPSGKPGTILLLIGLTLAFIIVGIGILIV